MGRVGKAMTMQKKTGGVESMYLWRLMVVERGDGFFSVLYGSAGFCGPVESEMGASKPDDLRLR
jgi:hypothetical protein